MPNLRAFFASPFRSDYLWIRDAVAAACREMEVTLRVVDETVLPGRSIIDAIHLEIAAADIGIAVVSDFNSNVMYELGHLFGQGKPTILLADTKSIGQLPFDFRSFSILSYDAYAENRADLTNVVAKSLGKLKQAQTPEFLQQIAYGKTPSDQFSTLTATVTASEIRSGPIIDWQTVKEDGERMLSKKNCKPIEIVVIDTDDFKGWRQTLDCPCGDTVIIIVDLNGRIIRVKTR